MKDFYKIIAIHRHFSKLDKEEEIRALFLNINIITVIAFKTNSYNTEEFNDVLFQCIEALIKVVKKYEIPIEEILDEFLLIYDMLIEIIKNDEIWKK